jgi:tRNA A-37 threonylcarbamoyl transferase component Bud32
MGRPGAVLGGRYELLEQIGSGASAITWKARDPRLGRTVAVKVLRRSYATDPTFSQRFEREAQAAASLSHGNVVDVYDVGQDGDSLYLVMQYIDGEDLKHLIQRRGNLTMDQAKAITTQVLAGLEAIHKAGIIHRDVKPQNVLMGRDGVARLTDFGVAQVAVDAGLTTQGTTVGTAAYMAPEQAKAETLSEATDVYAVGVMLYEMLTGTLPFTGATPMALMLAHIQNEPIPPSQAFPELGIASGFDNIVLQAMAKVPEDRFRTAGAMSRALVNASMVGGTTSARTVVAPAAVSTGARTRVAPAAAGGSFGQASARRPATSAGGGPPTDLAWARESASDGSGDLSGGMRGVLWGFLVLIALVLLAIGWYVWNEYGPDDNDPSNNPGIVVPTRTAEPTQDDSDDTGILPTDEEEPTAPPTEEPESTDEPTQEPTDEPDAEPTEERVIEPSDPTNAPPEGSDGDGSNDGEDPGNADTTDTSDGETIDLIEPDATQTPGG